MEPQPIHVQRRTPLARNPCDRCLAALLLVVVTLFADAAEAANPPALRFLGNKNIAPVVYVEDGRPVGVAVDIVRALAQHMPRPVDVQAMDWQQAQELVARGEADALIQINRTPERTKLYEFSEPLLESQFSIFVRSNRVGISGISSLRGYRVGVESAGLPRQLLDSNPNIRLVTIPNFTKGFQLLSEGVVDAVVVDYRVGSYVLAQGNIRDIRAVGEPIAFSFSAIAVKKGNTKLLSEIDAALRAIKADGTYQRVLDKWKPTEAVFLTRQQLMRRLYVPLVVGLFLLLLLTALYVVSLQRELFKRRTAEERLAEQYSMLLGIINSGDALIFSVDCKLRYTSFNQGHAAIMNALYGAQIELGRSILEYMTVPTDRETAKRNLERALGGEQLVEESYSGEEPRTRHYFQVSHAPIRSEGGAIIGVAVLAQNMTERKRAEEEVRILNRELDQRVRERTAELYAANQELEAFAYSVSHDLRAPVRHINGFVELLKKGAESRLDERSRYYLERVSDSSNRMGDLIDALLSFSRMGRVEIARTPVNLNALVRDVIKDCEPETRNRRVRWTVAELPTALGDETMLRQVLANLISNALKFSRTRGTSEIEIGYDREVMSEIVLFVRDNGVGFDAKYANKLFRVFQRLHRSDEFDGIGIGLASVQRIVARHGGRTWAEGTLDEGATFYFSLPRATARE